jgi:hypothetical protein
MALPVWLDNSELGAVWKLSDELAVSNGAGLVSVMDMTGVGTGVVAGSGAAAVAGQQR